MAYEFIDITGVIVADTSATQTEVEEEYKAALGQDLNVNAETPEGVLISAEVTSRNGIATNNAQLANQINPNKAGGVFLDAIWALTGGTRAVAESSTFVAAVDVTGVSGSLIPIGSIAETPAGDQFESLGNVTLDGGGLGSVAFASVEKGEIPAAIGALSVIVSAVLGWETVDNTVAATLGTDAQSDISARSERNDTLALQGASMSEAIFSNTRAVEGTTSLTYRENIKNIPVTIDNVTLSAHSIWACVAGGSDLDVATAILRSKSVGADFSDPVEASNPVVQNVTDPISGQIYSVLFNRPDLIPVLYRVTISPTTISNPVQIIKDAILAYAAGEIDGQDGLRVGSDVSGFEASGAVNSVEPGLNVTNVEVTKAAVVNFDQDTIPIEIFEQATVVETSITVVIA